MGELKHKTVWLIVLAVSVGCENQSSETFSNSVETVDGVIQNFGNEGGNGDGIDPDNIAGSVDTTDLSAHFDVDAFLNDGSDEWLRTPVYHRHAFDTIAPHYSVCNFVSYRGLGFKAAAEACPSDLTYRVRNATKGAGDLRLVMGGVETFMDGYPTIADTMKGMDEFTWASCPAVAGIEHFTLEMENYQGVLAHSKPSFVQNDTANRDGAFTIQLFCGSEEVWEFSVYEHVLNREDRRAL